MATLSKEEIEAIVERDMPGHRLVRGAADERADDSERSGGNLDSRESGPDSDAASPNLDTLREKLRRRRGGNTRSDSQVDARASRESDDADDDEDIIVAVRPKVSRDPFDVGPRTKAVVISGRSKRVIGRQG
ncbi:MAG TPA: hypothetical protein VJ715_16015 [Pyrinomonadaceae bacterium]|nr:hypothetical protein [Pyrinomonadaceae bacterium]